MTPATSRPAAVQPTPMGATPGGYNLRAAVDQIIDDSGLTDPREIARKVAENVPARSRIDVLAETLIDYVRIRQNGRRRLNPVIGPASARSAKVAAYREYGERWRRHLRDVVHVGNAVHVSLGQCTYDDLMYAARERQGLAAANAAAAARYEALAALLKQHDAKHVADLPASVLRGLFTERAA